MAKLLEVRFVSSNRFKIGEAQEILEPLSVAIIPSPLKIEELQTADTASLVRDKVLKAYRKIGRPLFVEHTGLSLETLNGMPGGLTQVFWDTLEADRFAQLFGQPGQNRVVAKTSIAYCDGHRIHQFNGEVSGLIVSTPRGSREFQWDCVFQPDGYDQTFAELGTVKNKISMRRVALDKFGEHLRKDLGR